MNPKFNEEDGEYLECNDCGNEFHINRLTRCLECDNLYCVNCYEEHPCDDDLDRDDED